MSADRWVLVPVEPTPEMVQAAITAWVHAAPLRARDDAGTRAWKAALAAAPAAPAAESPEPQPLQGGLNNEELCSAWAKKLPGVVATERDLSAFAVGVEVGFAHARDLEPLTDEQIAALALKVVYEGDASTPHRDAWVAEIGVPFAHSAIAEFCRINGITGGDA